jgi:hypothetical protein
MSKDLVRGTKRGVSKRTETESEIAKAQQALAESMLFGTQTRPQGVQDHPRIVLALDCTSSMGEFLEERKITPEAARAMANALFVERTELQVRLAYFRGDDQFPKQPRQFRVSNRWYDTPEELARAIAAIEHWPGWTQHCALLRHAVDLAREQAVQEVLILSDAFEEATPLRPQGDDLTAARVHARRLHNLGVKIVFGYKGTIRGGCPLDRAGIGAEQAFKIIAQEAGGYTFLIDPATLPERFAEIATQASLVAKGDAAGAQRLIEHLQTIPFEMTVDARVPSTKCEP